MRHFKSDAKIHRIGPDIDVAVARETTLSPPDATRLSRLVRLWCGHYPNIRLTGAPTPAERIKRGAGVCEDWSSLT